jgi:hypothetical protein
MDRGRRHAWTTRFKEVRPDDCVPAGECNMLERICNICSSNRPPQSRFYGVGTEGRAVWDSRQSSGAALYKLSYAPRT